MDSAVISDRLSELIKGRDVLAAILTTYTFEPEFFELEVIPLLLSKDVAYSIDERVKQFMVRENLRESDLTIDVFYDSPMYRISGNSSPQMEYLCHGVNLGNRAFHGKVNMLLVSDKETGEQSLLLGAGSNNLSRAGWWDNIECQHWVEIWSGSVSTKSLKLLKEDIEFLRKYSSFNTTTGETAFHRIADYIANLKGGRESPDLNYYGLSYPENHGGFSDFLKRKNGPLNNYKNWTLEIISPFFADDVNNKEHEVFFDIGINEIKLLLPMDEDSNALCDEEYFRHIEHEEGIAWAQWSDTTARALGVNGYYRRLHAKVYHFYNKVQSWVFVGSVNFTHKALHENSEAGFIEKLDYPGPLLDRLPENKTIDKFIPPDEIIPGVLDDLDAAALIPEIHLCYDWVTKTLTGRVEKKRACYEIEIIGAEGASVIEPWTVRYQDDVYAGDTLQLEKLLRNGSMVKVRGRNLNNKEKTVFSEHQILLQQIGWSHKPLNLPELTASQILAIYAGMSLERRQMMLMNAKIRELVLSAQGGELTANNEDQIVDQFFCEYAEIFNAFNKLNNILENALENDRYNQVDYYLTGTGVDSLKSLVQRALEIKSETSLNSVASYLVLLSALETYNLDQYIDRPNVSEERESLLAAIKSLKKSDRLKLEDNSTKNRNRFFKWYEEEFFRIYVTAVVDK